MIQNLVFRRLPYPVARIAFDINLVPGNGTYEIPDEIKFVSSAIFFNLFHIFPPFFLLFDTRK